uniref:Plant heme peroxidase family profile domain-containing protein n=1 Tax=Oryza brachyantha TaxID=4533 RepID=J3N151_ORYBR
MTNKPSITLFREKHWLLVHDFPASGCPHSTLWRRSRPLSRRGAPPWSCADILIYAARDTGSILGNGRVNFDVPVGRLDCLVSSADEAQAEIPDPTLTLQQLIDNFITKTFTVEEKYPRKIWTISLCLRPTRPHVLAPAEQQRHTPLPPLRADGAKGSAGVLDRRAGQVAAVVGECGDYFKGVCCNARGRVATVSLCGTGYKAILEKPTVPRPSEAARFRGLNNKFLRRREGRGMKGKDDRTISVTTTSANIIIASLLSSMCEDIWSAAEGKCMFQSGAKRYASVAMLIWKETQPKLAST